MERLRILMEFTTCCNMVAVPMDCQAKKVEWISRKTATSDDHQVKTIGCPDCDEARIELYTHARGLFQAATADRRSFSAPAECRKFRLPAGVQSGRWRDGARCCIRFAGRHGEIDHVAEWKVPCIARLRYRTRRHSCGAPKAKRSLPYAGIDLRDQRESSDERRLS